jgi:hypothetical protein
MVTVDAKREFLRHSVATLAYRGSKAIRGAPEGFAALRVSDATRSAVEILAHIGDLLEWALWLAKGQRVGDATPQAWELEVDRFFEGLRRFDEYLAAATPLACAAEKLFQGPIADALTHVGQIATLRRLAGSPAVRTASKQRSPSVVSVPISLQFAWNSIDRRG